MTDFQPNPMYAYGRVDTSAGEGGESLHKVNPNLFGVTSDGHIGRGAEVDGAATSEEISIVEAPLANVPEPPADTPAVEPTFAPEGGTVDTGPGVPPSDPEETPAEETVVEEPAEVVVVDEVPAEAPAEVVAVEEAPAEETPAEEVKAEEVAAEEAPVEEAEVKDEPESEPTKPYEEMLKAELIALANERDIDSSGTKAEIITRLEIADAAKG